MYLITYVGTQNNITKNAYAIKNCGALNLINDYL